MERAYFITICTQNREHYFGEIVQPQFIAAPNQQKEARLIAALPGELVENFWHEIPTQFPYAALGDFVVMPNHIHGILILDKPDEYVQTRLIASPQSKEKPTAGGFAGNKNPMLNDNISRIIRWYKGRCSFEIRKTNHNFAWQPRFHDHIIKNELEYQRISDYIVSNPKKWADDKFH